MAEPVLPNGHDSDVTGDQSSRAENRLGKALAAAVFLCAWPVIALLHWWKWLPGGSYVGFLVVSGVLYLRILMTEVAIKLRSSHSKGHRDFDGQVDGEIFDRVRKDTRTGGSTFTPTHLRQFATAILTPRAIRRRVTDNYEPSNRTLRKRVTIEFDLTESAGVAGGTSNGRTDRVLVALMLARKGQLYDHLTITDAAGTALPRVSQREYRVLAARTLRALLLAAYHNQRLPKPALATERDALREILRFTLVERRMDEPKAQWVRRRDDSLEARTKVVKAIEQLPGGDRPFLKLAAELVAKLSLHYVIMAVVPANSTGRYVLKYSYTLVPTLTLSPLMSGRGIRERLHFTLGTHPVYLAVSARNAVSCQSYHLLINGSSDLYVGDFDVSAIQSHSNDGRGDGPRLEPYWRLRPRRGQGYFHLYTRGLVSTGKEKDPDPLAVGVKFFEKPPGSLGRAGVTALAVLVVVAAVGWAVTAVADVSRIDTEVAAFLLATPGLAAAWLGFDAKPQQLFQGTLTTRLSSALTFLLSLVASITLFLNTSGVIPPHPITVFVFGPADLWWTALTTVAAVHAAAVLFVWRVRSNFYRRLAVRPSGHGLLVVDQR